MNTDHFTNLQLVKEVEQYEFLYNKTLPNHLKRNIAKKAWKEIGEKLNLPAETCKTKWRNLRKVFIRNIKRKGKTSHGKYYLSNAMKFCLPDTKAHPLDSSNNVESQQGEESYYIVDGEVGTNEFTGSPESININVAPDLVYEPVESASGNMTQETTCDNLNTGNDEGKFKEYLSGGRTQWMYDNQSMQENETNESLKMFLLSLIPELAEFSNSQIKMFKRRVFQLIDELSNQRFC